MRRTMVLPLILTATLGLLLAASQGGSTSLAPSAKLPEPVERTFRSVFPRAAIDRLDVAEEDGVMVYDFEFTDGKLEKETDITADGTMLETTLVVVPKVVTAAALKTIRETAKGAKLGRLERIEVSYVIESGKIVRLPAEETRFACEMSRGGKKAEVIVDAQGKVIEAPEWVSAKEPKTKPAGKTPK